MTSDSAAYRDFVRRAARDLVAVPDSVMSLLCGRSFLALRPELYEKVREGQARFGLSTAQVYDDLAASCAIARRTLAYRLYFCFVRGVKYLFLLLRLAWLARVVFPLTSRHMRGSAAVIAADNPRPRSGGQGGASPQASIVVLSYNRLAYLQTTIAAFLETVGDVPHELIVVDNGSRDGSVEFLRDCRQRGILDKLLLLETNQGISAGYNLGFAAADPRSEYVMKLDSDMKLLTPGWLAEAIDFLSANRDVGFVGLNLVNHAPVQLLPRRRRGRWELLDFADWTAGGTMLVPMRVQRELGWFIEDPQLRYTPDDIDYYVRASRKGYRAFFLRRLLVYHQQELDGKDYLEYSRGKPAGESSLLAIRLAGEYDRGTRPLEVHDAKYRTSDPSA